MLMTEIRDPRAGLGNDSVNAIVARKLKGGDTQTFTRYYSTHLDSVKNFALKLIKIIEEAEQIANDSFLKYWKVRQDFNSLPEIKGYIYECTRNACIDYIRRQDTAGQNQKHYEYLLSQGQEYFINEQIRAEVVSTIYAQIEHLPAQQQQIFKLIYFDGLKAAKVAEMLNISIGVVRTQHWRTIKSLRSISFPKDYLTLFILLIALYTYIHRLTSFF
ncbi:MAG TPA: sigma-70 family RNA polymerase sigma factor [Puia sp.]|jgi:RNA polymerase sigma-70 factor (ECF subfamily)